MIEPLQAGRALGKIKSLQQLFVDMMIDWAMLGLYQH